MRRLEPRGQLCPDCGLLLIASGPQADGFLIRQSLKWRWTYDERLAEHFWVSSKS